jgi:hypothetical protein
MPFVYSYAFEGPSRFRKAIPVTQRAGGKRGDTSPNPSLAIGSEASAGLAALIDANGKVVWSRRYSSKNGSLAFHDAVEAGKGEPGFVLLSAIETTTAGRLAYVVIRIDASGNLKWARQVKTDRTRFASRLLNGNAPMAAVAADYEEFLLLGWANASPGSSRDEIELIRLRGDGTVLNSVRLKMGDDDEIQDAIPFGDGYLLIGDSVRPPGLAGFLIFIDGALNVRGSWLLTGTKQGLMLTPRAALALTDRLLIAGRCSPDNRVQSNMIVELGTTQFAVNTISVTLTKTSSFSLTDGEDLPTRIAAIDNDFLVFNAPNAFVRPQTVVRFDTALAVQGHYGFDFAGGAELQSFEIAGRDAVLIAGVDKSQPKRDQALLLRTGKALECCKRKILPPPALQPLPLKLENVKVAVTEVKPANEPLEVVVTETPAKVTSLCGGTAIELAGDRLVQSPYLNLQAAGSTGQEASTGILLRWFLGGALQRHLPKGSLAQTTSNFNKPDDFVTIYRAPSPSSGLTLRRLSFATDKPIHVDNGERALVFETGTGTLRDLFFVRFADTAAYSAAGQSANPMQDPAGFLAAYGAKPVEIELRNVLALACDLDFQPNAAFTVQLETLSVADNRPLAAKRVTSRRVLSGSNGPTAHLVAENMRSVRLSLNGTQLRSIAFLCYDDILSAVNANKAWTSLGQFALTLDQATAFRRLEDRPAFPVHGLWRRFNDGAFVNVNNYRARWQNVPDGIAAAVQQYVHLSDTDPAATATLAGSAPEDASISSCYLDLLNLAALDYHVARMLGLGHVDNDGIDQNTSYIHVAEYMTLGDLGDGKGARRVQHLYMSLPTKLAERRLPFVPEIQPIEYGLSVPTGNGPPLWLTDQQGYTPDGVARYIRLYPDCEPLYEEEQGFFIPPLTYDFAVASMPVLYGVEYRKLSEPGWRKPEIAHDANYVDTATTPLPEAIPTPFPVRRGKAAFIHKETESGIHEYALYSVDIFSRASPLSPTRATDQTEFRRPNRLLPPSDLQVQIIQKEAPLVLTTNSEQAMLAALVQLGGDSTLVRVIFNYGHTQDTNYDFADAVEIFFRGQLPGNVLGGVLGVGSAADPALLRIATQPYTYISTSETVAPEIAAAQKANFLGGAFVAGGQRFAIEDIDWADPTTGKDPIFVIRKSATTGVLNAAGANTVVIDDIAAPINPGDLVMAVENMAAATSWGPGNPLATTTAIGDSSWKTRTESFIRPDNTKVNRRLRGVWETAQVDPIPNDANHYQIIFDTYFLNPHPQSLGTNPVNWHKGIVRLSVAGRDPEDRRALTVLQVLQSTGGTLELIAVDASGEADPVIAGLNSSIIVNYYPGYKVYLHADSIHGFDAGSIMPAPGGGSKATLLGLRAVDTSTLDPLNQPYRSPLGVPQPLMAAEIIDPQTPLKPKGLKYATPPDAYAKSSYTLTVDFSHRPFAAAFYRADAFTILRALYGPDTFALIRAALFPPEKDSFFANRFDDLLTFGDSASSVTQFSPFPLNGDSFVFPFPDSAPFLADAGTLLENLKAKIKSELMKAFLPLTEQPLIYNLIRADATYVPTNQKQTFRDANGDLLAPGVWAFDLAPMAKRSEANGVHTIEFVDFTLDGSMNPNTVYFYFARELGNRMQLGEASPTFGPVKLVNLSPPSAPKLRKISTVPYDALTGHNPEVRFEVVVPSSTDPITKLRIYRADAPVDALTLRTMTPVKEVTTLVPTADGTFIVADDFSSDLVVPYGEPLFYRLAWVRDVFYEDELGAPQTAAVISEPTQTFLANLIDIVNPTAPMPVLHLLATTSAGEKLVRMSWNKATHNGTYYVSRLDPSGNWVRLISFKTNDDLVSFDLPDALPVDNEDGEKIYYRFKVDVENSSGLLNQVASPITASLDSI